MAARLSLIFCLVVGASTRSVSAEDNKPLMTTEDIRATCEAIEKSPAADEVTKRKVLELQRLTLWECARGNFDHDTLFDSLEKMDDGTYLVKLGKWDREQGRVVTEVKYDTLKPKRQEQLKDAWRLWNELSPIAKKISSGSMPVLETSKVKTIIDGSQVYIDCTTISECARADMELADVATRAKARGLCEEMHLCGSYADASIEALVINNDGTAWVEICRDKADRETPFPNNRMVKYTDLDAESQQRLKKLAVTCDEMASIAADIRTARAGRAEKIAAKKAKATEERRKQLATNRSSRSATRLSSHDEQILRMQDAYFKSIHATNPQARWQALEDERLKKKAELAAEEEKQIAAEAAKAQARASENAKRKQAGLPSVEEEQEEAQRKQALALQQEHEAEHEARMQQYRPLFANKSQEERFAAFANARWLLVRLTYRDGKIPNLSEYMATYDITNVSSSYRNAAFSKTMVLPNGLKQEIPLPRVEDGPMLLAERIQLAKIVADNGRFPDAWNQTSQEAAIQGLAEAAYLPLFANNQTGLGVAKHLNIQVNTPLFDDAASCAWIDNVLAWAKTTRLADNARIERVGREFGKAYYSEGLFGKVNANGFYHADDTHFDKPYRESSVYIPVTRDWNGWKIPLSHILRMYSYSNLYADVYGVYDALAKLPGIDDRNK